MGRPGKTEQLQIRVSPAEKSAIERCARVARMGMSRYVLSRLLPAPEADFGRLAAALERSAEPRYVLAEIHDLLERLSPGEFAQASAARPAARLSPYLENYLAAMLETAAARLHVAPPPWVGAVGPLQAPAFGSDLIELRLHLLARSPAPFRRRNIFIDSSVGARV